MNWLEKVRVMPLKTKFYKRYIDDTITKRKNTDFDQLFQNENSHHPNIIKLTVETQLDFRIKL